jgi:hypothetical protein
VDVVSAFARMLRSVLFDCDLGDEAWLRSLRDHGFSEDDIKAIYDVVTTIPWGVEDLSWEYFVAQEFYNNTWFSQEYLYHVISTSRGSCAGMPLADIIYGLTMARVLWKLHNALANLNYTPVMSSKSGGPLPFKEVSYHDDLALLVAAPAPLLVLLVGCTVSVVIEVFTSFFLSVNLQPGKTEGILNFFGPQSKIEERKLAKNDYLIPVIHTVCKTTTYFRVVPLYKHVGTKAAFSKTGPGEVAYRAAIMRSDLRKVAKHINKLVGLTVPKKLSYVKGYEGAIYALLK